MQTARLFGDIKFLDILPINNFLSKYHPLNNSCVIKLVHMQGHFDRIQIMVKPLLLHHGTCYEALLIFELNWNFQIGRELTSGFNFFSFTDKGL